MGKKWRGRVAAATTALILSALSAPVMAQDPVNALTWEAGLGGEALWFDWREYQGAEQLLVESGPVFLLRADAGLSVGASFAEAELAAGGGKVSYDGQLQNGTPYQADAWENLMEIGLRVGVQQAWGRVFMGFRQRDWDRHIDGSATVASAHETYVWRLATAGGEFRFKREGEWQAALALEAGLPLSSHERVESNFFGDFDLEPGDGYYLRLSLPWRQSDLQLTPFVQWQSMDQSRSLLLSGADGNLYQVFQPESERIEAGVQLRYRFAGSAAK